MSNERWSNNKKEFILQIKEAGMSKNYINSFNLLFKSCMELEGELNKDLFDFNIEETQTFLQSLRSRSRKSLETKISMIIMYRKWAYQQKRTQGIYITKAIENFQPEDFVNLVAENSKYITKKELYHLALDLNNARDGVIILLLWWGIRGKQYSEIANLRKEDVNNISQTIKLKDRILKVDDFTIELINEANQQQMYYVAREDGIEHSRRLEQNDFVIRRASKRDINSPVKHYFIQKVVADCKEELENGFINPTNIIKSGEFYRFKEKYLKEAIELIKLKQNKSKTSLDLVKRFFKEVEKKEISSSYAVTFLGEFEIYLKNYELEEVASTIH